MHYVVSVHEGNIVVVEGRRVYELKVSALCGFSACSWASGRGLLEVYWGWTDAASAWHLEEVY